MAGRNEDTSTAISIGDSAGKSVAIARSSSSIVCDTHFSVSRIELAACDRDTLQRYSEFHRVRLHEPVLSIMSSLTPGEVQLACQTVLQIGDRIFESWWPNSVRYVSGTSECQWAAARVRTGQKVGRLSELNRFKGRSLRL